MTLLFKYIIMLLEITKKGENTMDKLDKIIGQATKIIRKLTLLALELATLISVIRWLVLNR